MKDFGIILNAYFEDVKVGDQAVIQFKRISLGIQYLVIGIVDAAEIDGQGFQPIAFINFTAVTEGKIGFIPVGALSGG
jgi:hypothetical protein